MAAFSFVPTGTHLRCRFHTTDKSAGLLPVLRAGIEASLKVIFKIRQRAYRIDDTIFLDKTECI